MVARCRRQLGWRSDRWQRALLALLWGLAVTARRIEQRIAVVDELLHPLGFARRFGLLAFDDVEGLRLVA